MPSKHLPSQTEDTSSEIGLYVHVPFCQTRCAFCAFYLQIHRDDRAAGFIHSLSQEIDLYAGRDILKGRSLSSVYLGGGTPTTLSGEQLTGILGRIRSAFPLDSKSELTIEAHPDTVSLSLLQGLYLEGFTRLSLGAESMEQEELVRVGRPTLPQAIVEAMTMAREVGFTNINVDLMYGLPGQTRDSWISTLKAIMALQPAHVSCYALTVEDGTSLAQAIAQGHAIAPDASLQTELELAAEALLTESGYHRYELSNYARPGYECHHNLLYWQNGSYLGLGPSAESYLDGVRSGNLADLQAYSESLDHGVLPLAHRDELTPEQQRREALVFGLRRLAGVERELVETLCQDDTVRKTLDTLISEEFLQLTDSHLKLTPKGRQLADSVSLQLI